MHHILINLKLFIERVKNAQEDRRHVLLCRDQQDHILYTGFHTFERIYELPASRLVIYSETEYRIFDIGYHKWISRASFIPRDFKREQLADPVKYSLRTAN